MTTIAQFITEFTNARNGQIMSIVTDTEVTWSSKANPFVGSSVRKVSVRSAKVGCDYERVVNNREEKANGQRTFTAAPLPWGQWLVPNKVITHNGNFYIRVTSNGNIAKTEYYINGVKATDTEVATIKVWEKGHKPSAKQSAVGIADKDQVRVQSINVANIISAAFGGNEYLLR